MNSIGRATVRHALLALCLLSLASVSLAGDRHGYLRTVEGTADLLVGRTQTSIEATANYPIQVGDQVLVGGRGRLEAFLPDASRVRIANSTQLRFARLAGSLDSVDTDTLLELVQGTIQISRAEPLTATDAFRVDTANATVELLAAGRYRLFTDGFSWTEVVVRSGTAEVMTPSHSVRVAAGQRAVVDGTQSPRVAVSAAPPLDSLERWSLELERQALLAVQEAPVEPELRYAATPLMRHGRWINYGSSRVWRPHAPTGWRPYHAGWWIYTPSGLTWISTEPWGWLTYHYGYWWDAPGSGWVWLPGPVYTPGSVRWYWGRTHVGWYPTLPHLVPWVGQYTSPLHGPGYTLYHRYHLPSGWRDWTFCRYGRFGYRDSYRYLDTGADLVNHGVFANAPPKGVVTTDTRAVTPDLWTRPNEIPVAIERSISQPIVGPESALLPQRSRRSSPLGAAAIGHASPRTPSESSAGISEEIRTGVPARPSGIGAESRRPVRQWDASRWRSNNGIRTRDRPTVELQPGSRDARDRGIRGTPPTAGGRSTLQRPGRLSPLGPTRPGISRPGISRPGRSRPGLSRPGTSRPGVSRPGIRSRPGMSKPGGSASPGRPGRVGGSSRPGGRAQSSSPPRSGSRSRGPGGG